MKLLLIQLICLLATFAYAIVLQPLPTRTIGAQDIQINKREAPTAAPVSRFIKRDLDDTLSLYENWADACNNNDDDVDVAVSGLNNLWQTVTSTVYCGNGNLKTVTKTMTAKATVTVTKGSNKDGDCDDTCWSTYLWHTYGYGITVAQGFTGIVCMLFGIYFMVFGCSCYRITLGSVGFVFFAVMTWIGLVNNEPLYGYPHNEIVYICVSAGLGVVGAFLFIFLHPIALYFVGGLGGFFMAVYILSWKVNLVIQIAVARICFITGMGIVMAILLILAESYIVILCTSFIGAYLFILGLDLFIHTGFINSFLTIFDGNHNHVNVYIMRTPVYVTLAFVVVLCLGSCGWQYYWNVSVKKKSFGVNVIVVDEEKEGK